MPNPEAERERIARIVYAHMVTPAHEPGMKEARMAADAILNREGER
jgi:hypothetical protein